MKKLLFTLGLVAIVGLANAQTDQGGWVVGASSNLGFSSTSIDGASDNTSNFNLGTRAGYFVIDNLSLGLLLSYDSETTGDLKDSGMTIGPWARYYVGGQFFVGASYGVASTKSDNGSVETKTSGGNLMLEAGYPIFMGDNVAIEPALNYNMGMGDFDGRSSFGLGVGFMLYF